MRFGAVAGLVLIVVAACASAKRSGAAAAAFPVGPTISSISPTSGPAGTAYPIELTISGLFFADSANTVTFGPVTLKSVKSSNGGTRIVVFAPKDIPSTGEVPPAPLLAGQYSVRVTTSAGASNTVIFNLTNAP